MRPLICLVLVCGLSSPVLAETQPSAWPAKYRNDANAFSWILVTSNVAADSVAAFRKGDRSHALKCLALRYAITSVAAHGTKYLVHRERPDGSDNKSFYSGHTAFGFVSSGWHWEIGVPIAIGTGYGRAAANKHYWSDIGVGAGVGLLTTKVCKP
jgi:hypothetical protein